MGGGIDMLALPTALVVPTSANRLFLLGTEGLGEVVDSKECEFARGHCDKDTEAFGDSILTGDGRLEELAEDAPLLKRSD